MPQDTLFPPLTTAVAEDVVGELEKALDVHRRWIKRFQVALVCRTTPSADDLASDSHERSEFGRWYHHGASRFIRRHPGFSAVGKKHQDMHNLAHQLAKVITKDDPVSIETYHSFSESVDAFKLSIRSLLVEAREFLRYTDPLTGVSNRATLMPRLEQEYQRVKRGGPASCMAMMDLDNFKDINDTYGHHAGDEALKEVASYLLVNIRQYDLIYRYGGEEFVLLLPNTVPERAKPLLDRLRRGLAKHPIPVNGKTITISASFGVAALSADRSVKATIERADQALYAAKDAGRNRVRVWEDSAEGPPKPANRKPQTRKTKTQKTKPRKTKARKKPPKKPRPQRPAAG